MAKAPISICQKLNDHEPIGRLAFLLIIVAIAQQSADAIPMTSPRSAAKLLSISELGPIAKATPTTPSTSPTMRAPSSDSPRNAKPKTATQIGLVNNRIAAVDAEIDIIARKR